MRRLGRQPYQPVWDAMRRFTEARGPATADELWLVEHPGVFTLGLNGKPEHLIAPGDIPVVQVDRGGQVTYHGPGQLIAYLLLDLRRRGLGVRPTVAAMERAVIRLLQEGGVEAYARQDAPGVYVQGAKIASLGLRVRRGCCYHGLSLNVEMDLEPFRRINPCGHAGMAVTQLRDLGLSGTAETLGPQIGRLLALELGYGPPAEAEGILPEPEDNGTRHE